VEAARVLAASTKGATEHDFELARLNREWNIEDEKLRQQRADEHFEKYGHWYWIVPLCLGVAAVFGAGAYATRS